ncbi:MAG: hypothetical protein ACK416_00380 [Zestosphaera sp.]
MRSKSLFFVVLAALSIRLIPTLITNQPFSTDTWPLIRLSRVLLTNPECKIWDDSLLGGYHNRWPAVILESTLYSALTGLEPAYFFRFVGVIITQTSMLITTYVLIRRYRGTYAALLGALTLTTIPSLVIFTSTTLKEVYAYPLALLFVLLLTEYSLSTLLLAFLVAFSLVVSHPLTPLMTIAFLGSYLFVVWVKRLEGLLHSVSVRKHLLALLLLSSTYATYMSLYGWEGLTFKFGLSDFLAILAVGVAVYGWYVLMGGDFTKSLLILTPGIISILVSNPRFLGFSLILLYAAPIIALLPYAWWGRGRGGNGAIAAAILLPISVGTQYIAVISPLLMTILHRLLNYLFFAATAITASLNIRSEKTRKYAVIVLTTSLIVTATISINLTFYGDPITYYWRYGDREVVGVSSVVKYVDSKKVCGDVKIKYLISGVVTVDPLCGLRLSETDLGVPAILYADNFRFGYALSPTDILTLQELRILNLVRDFVYSNGVVYVVR